MPFLLNEDVQSVFPDSSAWLSAKGLQLLFARSSAECLFLVGCEAVFSGDQLVVRIDRSY